MYFVRPLCSCVRQDNFGTTSAASNQLGSETVHSLKDVCIAGEIAFIVSKTGELVSCHMI